MQQTEEPLEKVNDEAAAIPSVMWNHDSDETNTDSQANQITTEPVAGDFSDLITLHTLLVKHSSSEELDRTISFSVAGDPTGTPTLFWYAGGCNRRILLLLQEAAEQCQLRLICLNRPGRGTTSLPDYSSNVEETTNETLDKDEEPKEFSIRVVMADERDDSNYNHQKASSDNGKNNSKLLSVSHARIYMNTCLSDAIAVLDALSIDQVGQFFECAGAPFALAFAQHYSSRLLSASPIIGIGSWIQPADCNETKQLFQFGARKCPVWLIAPWISGSMGSLDKSSSWVPAKWIGQKFAKSLTEKEQAVFDANWDLEEFVERFRFMQQEGGGTPMGDLTVLLSPSKDIGIDYSAITSRIVLVHAVDDKMSLLPAALWLKEQLPNCKLIQVNDATHEGMLFLLHREIEQSLKLIVNGEAVDASEEELSALPNGDALRENGEEPSQEIVSTDDGKRQAQNASTGEEDHEPEEVIPINTDTVEESGLLSRENSLEATGTADAGERQLQIASSGVEEGTLAGAEAEDETASTNEPEEKFSGRTITDEAIPEENVVVSDDKEPDPAFPNGDRAYFESTLATDDDTEPGPALAEANIESLCVTDNVVHEVAATDDDETGPLENK
jgi:pimeloyl-ACP methyl ester carboxylesterase